jgi:hypothetical protein
MFDSVNAAREEAVIVNGYIISQVMGGSWFAWCSGTISGPHATEDLARAAARSLPSGEL